jgi:type IV pilus assembly protein PilX
MMRAFTAQPNKQRGATLLVALIFLVIMAMLGVSVAQVTTLQEKMAGNTRDRDLALQAAEAALRDAELRLADAGFRAGAVTWDPTNPNNDVFWSECFSSTPTAPCAGNMYTPELSLPSSGSGAIASQPRYIVERKPNAGTTEVYRVTAYAVGGTADAVVILQAEFGI